MIIVFCVYVYDCVCTLMEEKMKRNVSNFYDPFFSRWWDFGDLNRFNYLLLCFPNF